MRRRIAVITARADDSEQRMTLTAIAETALVNAIDVVVFSNIYNYFSEDEHLLFENCVYDLFEPSMFDGVIIITEPFPDIFIVSDHIAKLKQAGTPAIVIGDALDDFPSLRPDDAADMEQLTEHLIKVHGIRRFDLLTGPASIGVSNERVEGCLRAFRKHHIAYDENTILYGNFWMDSGYRLGVQYADGSRELPEAVICMNDFMAYGLCESLYAAGISVPEQVTVVGYDNADRWSLYYPFLTSYSRDRRNIGYRAVSFLFPDVPERSDNTERLVVGETCGCMIDKMRLRNDTLRNRLVYGNVSRQMESEFVHKLTLSRDLSEFASVLEHHRYLLPTSTAFSLCLYRNWDQRHSSEKGRICCTLSQQSSRDFYLNSEDALYLPFQDSAVPHLYYVSPLTFQMNQFGYAILTFDRSDCYDVSYRNWLKTTSNALEMLRLKGDIHYLKQCQKVSELYDALTGFYRYEEFRNILMVMQEDDLRYCYLVGMTLVFPEISLSVYDATPENDLITDAARAVRSACSHGDICCRKGTTLLILRKNDKEMNLSDKVRVFVNHAFYERHTDKQFLPLFFASAHCPTAGTLEQLCADAERKTEKVLSNLLEMQKAPHYQEFFALHRSIHKDPGKSLSTEDMCKKLCLSIGYFRNAYKKCLGFSYAQDRINARIDQACYLLCTSVMSIYAIAQRVGYQNEKYLAKQFHDVTGMTPMQYRAKFGNEV